LYSSYGILRKSFSNEDINKLQILAENDIKQKMKNLNLYEEAKKNAKIFLDTFLKNLGFENIVFKEVKEPDLNKTEK